LLRPKLIDPFPGKVEERVDRSESKVRARPRPPTQPIPLPSWPADRPARRHGDVAGAPPATATAEMVVRYQDIFRQCHGSCRRASLRSASSFPWRPGERTLGHDGLTGF
jgi:hypothetical protein